MRGMANDGKGMLISKNVMAHKRLSAWLKGKREMAGLSQAQVAELIGRHRAFVGRYEAGGRLVITEFIRVAKALNADPHQAVGLIMGSRGGE